EHRSGVPEALHLVVDQAVLDTGAYATRRTLRAQGELVTIAVLEGVHFLFDNIGHRANGTLEQLGLLDDRGTDFLVTVRLEYATYTVLDKLPEVRLLRQNVVHASNRLQGCRHASVFQEQ